jgi:hypothetical protein
MQLYSTPVGHDPNSQRARRVASHPQGASGHGGQVAHRVRARRIENHWWRGRRSPSCGCGWIGVSRSIRRFHPPKFFLRKEIGGDSRRCFRLAEVLLRMPMASVVETRLFGRGESPHARRLVDIEVAHVLQRYALMGVITSHPRRASFRRLCGHPRQTLSCTCSLESYIGSFSRTTNNIVSGSWFNSSTKRVSDQEKLLDFLSCQEQRCIFGCVDHFYDAAEPATVS